MIPIIIGLNYGIWLVPIIPVVIYETRRDNSTFGSPILAATLTWCAALFSYYTYYALLLSFGKLPNLTHLNMFGDRFDGFWGEFGRMFNRIILFQFLEWIPIAIIGGTIIAAIFWCVLPKPNLQEKAKNDP